jgi:hypothetical protein
MCYFGKYTNYALSWWLDLSQVSVHVGTVRQIFSSFLCPILFRNLTVDHELYTANSYIPSAVNDFSRYRLCSLPPHEYRLLSPTCERARHVKGTDS